MVLVRDEEFYDHLSSIAMVIDDKIPSGTPEGRIVAFVVYTRGGVVIYKHRKDYTDEEILVIGESFFGETFQCARWKTYYVSETKNGEQSPSED